MLAERAMRSLICGLALCATGATAATEKEEPEVDFLEYLGMWEESDEDWRIFDETTLDETTQADNEDDKRSDPAPDGEESTEKEDES